MSVYLEEIRNYLTALKQKGMPPNECLKSLEENSAIHWEVFKIYGSLLSDGKTHKEIVEHFCNKEEEYILNNFLVTEKS